MFSKKIVTGCTLGRPAPFPLSHSPSLSFFFSCQLFLKLMNHTLLSDTASNLITQNQSLPGTPAQICLIQAEDWVLNLGEGARSCYPDYVFNCINKQFCTKKTSTYFGVINIYPDIFLSQGWERAGEGHGGGAVGVQP